MGMTLDSFTSRAREALKTLPGTAGREAIRDLVREALQDRDFVETYISDKTPERQVLYEDPELGFTVLAHRYEGAKNSKPHDHGPSWAIYGQASGETIMTEYQKLAPASEGVLGKARPVRDYKLTPGDAYVYNEGDLHSPRREGSTKLIRIEGVNVEKIRRFPYQRVESAAAAAQ